MRRAIENAIVKLGVDAHTDDVAEFLKTELPELETKRREVVKKAINEVNARASMASISDAEEVAFAPTVVGPASRDASKAQTRAQKPGKRATDEDDRPTKRPSQIGSARAVLEGREESSATRTSFVDDEEVAGLPRNRGFFLFGALLVLAGVAWFVWPGKAKLREMMPGYAAAPDPSPATSASAAPIPSATDSTAPAVSASASAAASAALEAGAPVAASNVGPSPTAPTLRTPSTNATPTNTAPPPTTTATATSTPTPTATSTEEENSPY